MLTPKKKKRGRPVKSQEAFRGCRIFVKLTPVERTLADSIASILAVHLSDLVRVALMREINREFKRVRKELGPLPDELEVGSTEKVTASG